MLSLLRRTMSRKETDRTTDRTRDYTKDIARDRLQTAIMRDRHDLVAPDVMEALRRDMLAAVSRHLEVGEGFQEFEIRRLNQSLLLVSNIRVKGMARWAVT